MLINQLLAYSSSLWRSRGRRHLLLTGSTDVLLLVFSLATGILTARLLGPDGRGELAIVIIWPSVIAAVGSLGVREALVYEQAKLLHPKSVLLGIAVILASFQSFALIALGWFLIPIVTQYQSLEVTGLTRQYLAFVFLNLLSLYLLSLLQGGLRVTLYNIVRLSVNAVYILCLLVLWAFDGVTVQNTVYALLIANTSTALLALIFNSIDSGISFNFRWAIVSNIFNYGLKSHIGGLSHMFNERLDQMVLALLLSPRELGWYVVAVSTANITKIAASPFAQIIFPRITGQNLIRQGEIVKSYSRYTIIATAFLGLGLLITLPILVPFVYGADFSPSTKPAQVLVVATFFLGLGFVWRQALSGMGRPFVASQAELLSLVVTAIGIYLFVPIYGILGAAWVSFVAYVLAAFYLGLKLKNLLGTSWGQFLGLRIRNRSSDNEC